jgi:hypothetical protein
VIDPRQELGEKNPMWEVNDGKVNDGKVNDGKVNDGKVNDGKVNSGGEIKKPRVAEAVKKRWIEGIGIENTKAYLKRSVDCVKSRSKT